MAKTTRVLMLSSRTGIGRAGHVVDYPTEDVKEHEKRGIIRVLKKKEAAALEEAEKEEETPPLDATSDVDLSTLTKPQLVAMALAADPPIEGAKRMNKAQLIAALNADPDEEDDDDNDDDPTPRE